MEAKEPLRAENQLRDVDYYAGCSPNPWASIIIPRCSIGKLLSSSSDYYYDFWKKNFFFRWFYFMMANGLGQWLLVFAHSTRNKISELYDDGWMTHHFSFHFTVGFGCCCCCCCFLPFLSSYVNVLNFIACISYMNNSMLHRMGYTPSGTWDVVYEIW